MIKSFKHKGLKSFFESGKTKGIQAKHVGKIRSILFLLSSATGPSALQSVPHLKPHKLIGKMKDHYSVSVSGNWRITFQFDGIDVTNIDYIDYH